MREDGIKEKKIAWIAAASFGSLELAYSLADLYPYQDDPREAYYYVGDFLLRQFPSLRDITDYQSAKKILQGFIPDYIDRFTLEKVLEAIQGAKPRILDRQEAMEQILSHPPVEGIPFAFRAANSRELYDKVTGQISLQEPSIDIIAPDLSDHTLFIAGTMGIPFRFNQDARGSNDLKFASRVLAVKEDNTPLPPAFRRRKPDLYSLGFRKTYLGAHDPSYGEEIVLAPWSRFEPDQLRQQLVEGVKKLLKGQKGASLDFHTHQHSLTDEMIKLSVALETLLQQLGISYVVSYPIAGRFKNSYYQYDPENNEMLSINNPET